MADPFRLEHRTLSDEEQDAVALIKRKAGELLDVMQATGEGRELALAVTKLEECVMWAVKGIAG
jgi:hypothetical protein